MPSADVPTVIVEEGKDNDDPDPADEPGEPGGPPSNPPNSPGGGGSPGGGPPGGGGGPPGGGPPGGGFPPFGNPPDDPNNNEQLAFGLLRQMNDFLKNLNITMQRRPGSDEANKSQNRNPDVFNGLDPRKLQSFLVSLSLVFSE